MPTITVTDLRTKIREAADQVNSEFITDTTLLGWVNDSYAAWWDLLCNAEQYYFATSSDKTVASGASSIDLTTISDFYRLAGLDDISSSDRPLTVKKFNFAERNSHFGYSSRAGFSPVLYELYGNSLLLRPAELAPRPYRVWYIPVITALTAGSDTLQTINGWHEWIVWDCAIKCLIKEESSTRDAMIERDKVEKRITTSKNKRDEASPQTVARVRNQPGRGRLDSSTPPYPR